MMVRYTSLHHSADDPGGLIREALEMGPDFAGPAEDVMLSWMLRLDESRSPEAAARSLLESTGHAHGPAPPGAAGRLVELLREAASGKTIRAQPRRRTRSRGAPR